MIRKVIKQGNGTLTITLPKGWTKKVGLKGGDEIDVEEIEKGIMISSEKTSTFKKITIDTTHFNERAIRLALSAAHKSGFDEIEIIYENPHIINIAHELVKELYMGFSVVEQTNKRCVLKSIALDKAENFDTILRRAFLVALSMGDSSLEMLKNKKFSDLPSLITLEHFNNQLTNFCERMLNKKEYKNGNCFYYVVAWNLEKICDNYKYICQAGKDNKKQVNKKIIDLYSEANTFFREYYELFYKFDMKHLVELTNQGKRMKNKAVSLRKEVKTDFEFVTINYLMTLVLQCLDFGASYIGLNGLTNQEAR